ncbi:LPXTG cell wall anchor domain-containing protein [Streptomyces sp. NPDC056660]|uniref:LPXTG cell wall anchor domain-containing protein n=1 Tax=Streptomyces sp. NPDC056660 TaxID=3345897 RepID=UPI0036CFCD1B
MDADSSSTEGATTADDSTPEALAGSLAHTGADATTWIAAGAGLLIAAGVVTLIVARRRTAGGTEPDDSQTR